MTNAKSGRYNDDMVPEKIIAELYDERKDTKLDGFKIDPAPQRVLAEMIVRRHYSEVFFKAGNPRYGGYARLGFNSDDLIISDQEKKMSPVIASRVRAWATEAIYRIDKLDAIEKANPEVSKASAQIRVNLVSSKPVFEVLPNGLIGPKGSLPTSAAVTTAVQYLNPYTPQVLADINKAKALANAVSTQATAARGPSGATPISPPKPSRPASRKPLPKPKGRR